MFQDLTILNMICTLLTVVGIIVLTHFLMVAGFRRFCLGRGLFSVDNSRCVSDPNFFNFIRVSPGAFFPLNVLEEDHMCVFGCGPVRFYGILKQMSTIFALIVELFSSCRHPRNPTINWSGDSSL